MSDSGSPRRIAIHELSLPAGSLWNRIPLLGLGVGVLFVAVSAFLGRSNPEQFFFSWLVAFAYFLSIALGGMFFVLVHYVTKAGWGVVVRRIAENAMATLPVFVVLFIPIALGVHSLYHWSHADAVAQDALLQSKQPFLNQGFFLIRAAVYLLAWCALAFVFSRSSRRQDETGDPMITRRLTVLSGPAIYIFALTVSFAAIDWIMSLDAHWYSTIFGVYYFAGCLVGFFALIVIVAASLGRDGRLDGVVTVEHFHDMGKLLFAFTVFWSYIAFSQYFLIWYANIPEETVWFLHRAEGGWKSLSLLLGWGHFAVPFFFLMSREIKRRTPLLVLGAVWMLLMHYVDIYWLVMPNLHHELHPSLLDVTTFVGVGALFLAVLGWNMRGPMVPVRDPRLTESLTFNNF